MFTLSLTSIPEYMNVTESLLFFRNVSYMMGPSVNSNCVLDCWPFTLRYINYITAFIFLVHIIPWPALKLANKQFHLKLSNCILFNSIVHIDTAHMQNHYKSKL